MSDTYSSYKSVFTSEELHEQNQQLRRRNEALKQALMLAREMFASNNLILPHTFEVIDEALKESE